MVEASTQQAAQQQEPPDYSRPKRFCDIVMKGGITSGVVYPSAVCELAVEYNFKSIGGASAGAIAAAAAGAAEYSRRMGTGRPPKKSGFERLEELPTELATKLPTLFQPNRATAPLYEMLYAHLELADEPSLFKRSILMARAAIRNFPKGAARGLWPGMVLLLILGCAALWVALSATERTVPWWFGFIMLFGAGAIYSVLLLLFFRVLGALRDLAISAASAIPDNKFGLCSGMKDIPGKHQALTEWLADELDQLAGKPDKLRPLTFHDLKSATTASEDNLAPDERGINLEMMTTNLTLGRPYRLPSMNGSREFFYDPAEFRQLFPERIVNWMVERSKELKPRDKEQQAEWDSFLPRLILPEPEDLPVVVAARMSLSYPVLLSAVPLYMVDRLPRTRAEAERLEQEDDTATDSLDAPEQKRWRPEPRLERCWFSDGGICSNFPIHFFDRPIPRWPTFGINLRPVHPAYHYDGQPQSEKVYLVKSNAGGLAPLWDRFDPDGTGFKKLAGFFGALVNTMYNWSDNLQTTVPGYRDRVVHIHHTENEGGMNLNMKEGTIRVLSERGRCAGEMLRLRFTGEDTDPKNSLSWDTHRWTRYRTTMSLLERMLSDLRRAYNHQDPNDIKYAEIVNPAAPQEPPKGYPISKARRKFAAEATEQFISQLEDWENKSQTFRDPKIPRPEPELRIRPGV